MSFPPFPSLWSKGNHGIVAELMEMCKISQGIAHSSWQIVGTLRKSFSPPMTPWRLWWSHLFVVQSLSRVWHFVTRWSTAHQACLSITISQSLHKLMSIESVTPSSHLVLCHLLTLLPSIRQHLGVFHRTPRDISCKCCFSSISFFCHILEKFLLNMLCQGIKKRNSRKK